MLGKRKDWWTKSQPLFAGTTEVYRQIKIWMSCVWWIVWLGYTLFLSFVTSWWHPAFWRVMKFVIWYQKTMWNLNNYLICLIIAFYWIYFITWYWESGLALGININSILTQKKKQVFKIEKDKSNRVISFYMGKMKHTWYFISVGFEFKYLAFFFLTHVNSANLF